MPGPALAARKRQVYRLLADVGRGLASPVRVELLERLADAPRTVEALAEALALPVANVSQHLGVLRGVGLVAATRRGRAVEYRLADATVMPVLAATRAFAVERGRSIEALADPSTEAREPVAPRELLRRARTGAVVLLDVRDPEEYAAGHLPHALSIPLPELRRRLRELPRGRAVVAYCRGPLCVMAGEAVALLRRAGRAADELPMGVVEWQAAGGRLARG